IVAIGRFGPYIKFDSKFISLRKEDDPMTVSAERCQELIALKRIADIEKYIKSFPENPEMHVLKGRWGAYLGIGKNNFRLPKGIEPTTLTYEECLEIATKAGYGTKIKPEAEKKAPAKKAAKKAAVKKTAVAKKVALKKPASAKASAGKPAAKKAAKKAVKKK
ncbi:MAG TPA: topoisomerase C-terminal repeat-containing protein, partial [Bacteroidia bacterium]|nr:topoisomerase C-terminal repeat-containing protein [Bacteroidia bacterium]